MPDNTPMGFGFGSTEQVKCLSCANRVKWDTIVCPTILKRLVDYCDKHPNIESDQAIFTTGLTESMSGCSNYAPGNLTDGSLASSFKLVSALSEIVRVPNKTKYIWDMQPGLCSNCGRRDWYTVDLTINIDEVVKKLKCRECDHEWEEVFTFREKRK